MNQDALTVQDSLCHAILSLRSMLISGAYKDEVVRSLNEIYLVGVFLYCCAEVEFSREFDATANEFIDGIDGIIGLQSLENIEVVSIFAPIKLIPVGSNELPSLDIESFKKIGLSIRDRILFRLRENIFTASLIDPSAMGAGDTVEDKYYILGLAEITAINISTLFVESCGVGARALSDKVGFIKSSVEFANNFDAELRLLAGR